MQALKFTLSGKTAFFKKPEMNTYFYFTYGQIHKVALLGLFGAVLGLKGYNHQYQEKTTFPEFYEELHNLKIAIVPRNDRGAIGKKMQQFNNSTAFASNEQGGNLIVKEQWLENPQWDIYILLDGSTYADKLAEAIYNRKTQYNLYLGKNDHFADLNAMEYVDVTPCKNNKSIVKSLCRKETVKIIENDDDDIFDAPTADFTDTPWLYEEMLPYGLTVENNQYELTTFLLTNQEIQILQAHDTFYNVATEMDTTIQFI